MLWFCSGFPSTLSKGASFLTNLTIAEHLYSHGIFLRVQGSHATAHLYARSSTLLGLLTTCLIGSSSSLRPLSSSLRPLSSSYIGYSVRSFLSLWGRHALKG